MVEESTTFNKDGGRHAYCLVLASPGRHTQVHGGATVSILSRRLNTLEERKAFREFLDLRREFDTRTTEDLEFFALHGYFPETLAGELPPRVEFTVAGIRTIIISERSGG